MRERLGRSTSMATRDAVYLADDGFEVESREYAEIVERRVLFDDIQLVTYHQEIGTAYVLITLGFALLFLIPAIGLAIMNDDGWIPAIFLGAFGVPALIAAFVRLIFRVDVIMIFGRRSKAVMRFALRKSKARETYDRVCAAVRQAQGSRAPENAPHDFA
jgi:hypothetical protein